jgi:hypothetical protein
LAIFTAIRRASSLLSCRQTKPRHYGKLSWLKRRRLPMLKASKQDVDYSRGHAGAHCGKVLDDDKAYCQHFIPPLSPASNLGQCQKVAGPINPVYWCRLFARAHGK